MLSNMFTRKSVAWFSVGFVAGYNVARMNTKRQSTVTVPAQEPVTDIILPKNEPASKGKRMKHKKPVPQPAKLEGQVLSRAEIPARSEKPMLQVLISEMSDDGIPLHSDPEAGTVVLSQEDMENNPLGFEIAEAVFNHDDNSLVDMEGDRIWEGEGIETFVTSQVATLDPRSAHKLYIRDMDDEIDYEILVPVPLDEEEPEPLVKPRKRRSKTDEN